MIAYSLLYAWSLHRIVSPRYSKQAKVRKKFLVLCTAKLTRFISAHMLGQTERGGSYHDTTDWSSNECQYNPRFERCESNGSVLNRHYEEWILQRRQLLATCWIQLDHWIWQVVTSQNIFTHPENKKSLWMRRMSNLQVEIWCRSVDNSECFDESHGEVAHGEAAKLVSGKHKQSQWRWLKKQLSQQASIDVVAEWLENKLLSAQGPLLMLHHMVVSSRRTVK